MLASMISKSLMIKGNPIRLQQVLLNMFGNAVDALEIYNSVKVDLVILDVVMSLPGGVACAREMRALNPEVKIVFATGYDRERRLEEESGFEPLACSLRGNGVTISYNYISTDCLSIGIFSLT